MASMFSGNLVITGGVFNHISPPPRKSFEVLGDHVAIEAIHNSRDASDIGKCHPGTRVTILRDIEKWAAAAPRSASPIKWLKGPAGSGKTAILKTIAESLVLQGLLIASFFFRRMDQRRGNAQFLIPTIAYQLAMAISATRHHIEEVIETDPLLFSRSLEAQVDAMILCPLRRAHADGHLTNASPRILLIDGLDECSNPTIQGEILLVIAGVLSQSPIPLAILISSRPQHHIRSAFDSGNLQPISSWLALDFSHEADSDIRKFFLDSFSVLKESHPFRIYIPHSWPDSGSINVLVSKASGQFIYATTVAKFCSCLRHHPAVRLKFILSPGDHGHYKPFQQLDLLYSSIFLTSPPHDRAAVSRILGVLLVRESPGYIPDALESFFNMPKGEIRRVLFDLESLLTIKGDGKIQIHHASLVDFLFDQARSGDFFIDMSMVYEDLAKQSIRNLKVDTSSSFSILSMYPLENLKVLLEKAAPTPALRSTIERCSILSLSKMEFNTPPHSKSIGVRLVCPLFLEAIRGSRLPDANTLHSRALSKYKESLDLILPAYSVNGQLSCILLLFTEVTRLPWRDRCDILKLLSEATDWNERSDYLGIYEDMVGVTKSPAFPRQWEGLMFFQATLSQIESLSDLFVPATLQLLRYLSTDLRVNAGPLVPKEHGYFISEVLSAFLIRSPVDTALLRGLEQSSLDPEYLIFPKMTRAIKAYISKCATIRTSGPRVDHGRSKLNAMPLPHTTPKYLSQTLDTVPLRNAKPPSEQELIPTLHPPSSSCLSATDRKAKDITIASMKPPNITNASQGKKAVPGSPKVKPKIVRSPWK